MTLCRRALQMASGDASERQRTSPNVFSTFAGTITVDQPQACIVRHQELPAAGIYWLCFLNTEAFLGNACMVTVEDSSSLGSLITNGQ